MCSGPAFPPRPRPERRSAFQQADAEADAPAQAARQTKYIIPTKPKPSLPYETRTRANCLPVSVDNQSGNVVGLPDSWIPRLQWAIMIRASRAAETKPTEEMARTVGLSHFAQERPRSSAEEKKAGGLQLPGPIRPSVVSEEDFCFTSAQHEVLLAAAMKEARSSIFVASPCPSIDRMEHLRDTIEAALKRGVNVDPLFEDMAGKTQEFQAVNDLSSKIAYEARREGSGGLRFSRQPSSLHGNLLLWNGRGGWSACVGSYRWLAMSDECKESSIPRDVTIRISEPGIVAALARCAIGFWSGIETEVLSSTADRWRGIATELDMIASGGPAYETNAKVCLVLDGEHETLINDWKSSAQSRVLVASHQLGSVSQILGEDQNIESSEAVGIDIVYGRADKEQAWLADVTRLVGERRGSLRKVDNFHGEVLITDASACVTSYNILAATSCVGSNGARKIGIVIEE